MTFETQSEWWIQNLRNRKRNPIKRSSESAFRSHLNWLIPHIGQVELDAITNRTLKELAAQLDASAKTVQCYLSTVKAVVASAKDENGDTIYKRTWNTEFIDAPEVANQKTPCFTAEHVADIVARGNGTSLLFKSAAVTGMRIGELLALEPRHVNGRTITVEQTLWNGKTQSPKTVNGYRQVDIPTTLHSDLSNYIGTRSGGYVFTIRTYGNALTKLHSILTELKIERTGFHAFRRFRETYLDRMNVPEKIQEFWMGWSGGKGKMRKHYSKLERDVEFRLAEAERVGMGF